jgi:hypothetical protein
VPQSDQHDRIIFGAGDGDRQVLMLLVIAVEHRQLLLTVRGIVEGVYVERQMGGRPIEGLDELIDQDVALPPEVGDGNGVLEA